VNTMIPFLWFESQAEEAARYYAGIFPGGKLGAITRFPAGAIPFVVVVHDRPHCNRMSA